MKFNHNKARQLYTNDFGGDMSDSALEAAAAAQTLEDLEDCMGLPENDFDDATMSCGEHDCIVKAIGHYNGKYL